VNIAIIPARGGSKRIPRKNVRNFCGKPMIAWSIEAAFASECFDRVLVSTDDEEIAAVARACGAETPFMRPRELADDFAGTIPVISHAVEWLSQRGMGPDLACCLYATAPFVAPADLCQARDLLTDPTIDYVFAAARFPAPIQRALRLNASRRIEMFDPTQARTRSQDLESAYFDAGQFYWGRRDAWLGARPIFALTSTVVLLPRHRVQDIDTEDDWAHAEILFKMQSAGVP